MERHGWRSERKRKEDAVILLTKLRIYEGLLMDIINQIKEIVGQMKYELGNHAQAIATGGQSTLFSAGEPIFDKIDPDLTLMGLQIIADLNP